MSRPDKFQRRLAHWILDQLKSDTELENVVQQFSLLISQTQDQVVGDLYEFVGRLIFQRAVLTLTKVESPKDDIRLCAELCYCLYSIHFERRPSYSPRITLVHEHIFELCISSFLIGSVIQSASMPDGDQSPTRLGATPPLEDKKTWIEKSSELLFHLFNLQLLSLAQISEYVSRVIKRPGALINTHLGNMMAGVRLLVGLFPGCSHGPWEKEVNSLRKWIDQHSSLDGNQANATTDSAIQEKEPRSGTVDTDNPRSDSVLCSSNKSNNPSPKSFNAPIFSSKTAHSSQRYNLEEEMDGTPGNNIGRPPRTPDTLRAESPVDTSSVDFSIFPPESTQWHSARGSSIEEEGRKVSQAAEGKAIKEAKHQTKEDSAARDQEKAGRNAKEKRRFKEEAKRKEEIRAKLEAERKVNKQTARKAREEAEHKAKVDKMREEMEKLARREAEIKARRAREQEAREEEVRKEMERKVKEDKARVDKMREEMERMVQKEAELKATRAAEHRARVEKMRENMEKMVQREAELRAERERERKEKVRKAREEAEEEKERRQAELEAQKMTELQAKEEAKRKALEPVPTRDPAPPRGPPQWELDGYYDLLHCGFNPYMYAGGLP